MKTANMKVLYDMDEKLENLVKRKQKEFACVVTLYHDEETGGYWMSVLTFDCRVWQDIQVSDRDSRDRTSTGIMRWFKEHGNEVKGG